MSNHQLSKDRFGWYDLWLKYPLHSLRTMRDLRGSAPKNTDLRVALKLELMRYDDQIALQTPGPRIRQLS